MTGRTLTLAVGLIGALLLAVAIGGCDESNTNGIQESAAPFEATPRAALLFGGDAQSTQMATEIGRSDWPSTPGAIEGPEFGAYSVTIYDYQGPGYGYGYGAWNNYNRYFRGYRVGSNVR
jgi:hypothetical protein